MTEIREIKLNFQSIAIVCEQCYTEKILNNAKCALSAWSYFYRTLK